MIMIGADSHKRTHTVVAVDEVGRRLAEKTVRTNTEGHLELLVWSRQLAGAGTEEVQFALEDCRHLTRRLEADLLLGGARVVRVPTRLMAEARKVGREPGKSDPIDAQAVALAALRHPELPVAELDGPGREVKLLSDHRRDLVMQRTRICSQVRWFVHELDPDLEIASRGLRRPSRGRRAAGQPAAVRRRRGPPHPRAPRALPGAEPADHRTGARTARPGPPARTVAARGPRLRRAVGRADPRRDRRGPPPPHKDAFARFTGTAPVRSGPAPAGARSASTAAGTGR